MGRVSIQKLTARWSQWGRHRVPLSVGGVPCGSVGVRPTQSRMAPGNRDADLGAGRGGGQEWAGRQAPSLLCVTRTPGAVAAPTGGGGGDASEAAVGGVQPGVQPGPSPRPSPAAITGLSPLWVDTSHPCFQLSHCGSFVKRQMFKNFQIFPR